MAFRSRSATRYSTLSNIRGAQAKSPPLRSPMFTWPRRIFSTFVSSFTNGWRHITGAFDHDRWRVLARCGIHLPPLAISAALLALNFSTTYYEDHGAPHQNMRFNALQFAAKLHEVLIAASLSMVVINYVQYELLHARTGGVSLGGLLAGFQIANLSSLWSPGLWNKCLAKGFKARRFRFALTIFAFAVLAAIAGPSSAILILPTNGWWTVPYQLLTDGSPIGVHSPQAHFFAPAAESVLWPDHITLDNFMPPNCTFIDNSIPAYCPAGGFSDLLAQASYGWNNGWNITMPTIREHSDTYQTMLNRILEGSNVECLNETSRFFTQTTATSVGNLLQSAWRSSGLKGQNTKFELSLSNGTSVLGPQAYSTYSNDEGRKQTSPNNYECHSTVIISNDEWSNLGH